MWEVGNMDKNMDNNYIDKISNKEVIRQLIIFAMKHRRIMQKFLDETGVYQAQHRLLMEIFRNPDASQNILPGRWMCLRQQ